MALHVYRIAEEAVANAILHAEAKTITITLSGRMKHQVVLSISDDGKGFDQAEVKGGLGLRNMPNIEQASSEAQ